MFFDIIQKGYINDKIYNSSFYKIRLNEELMQKYQNLILKGNSIYVCGTLNSYKKGTSIVYYINPREIKDSKVENNKTKIDYDLDGVMLWNGKRCESEATSEEEQKELEELLTI